MQNRSNRSNGFKRAYSLMQTQIREAGEARGFSHARILTHWAEIVGDALAAQCRPVNVTYAKGGLGATLTILTTGPNAPLIDMQKEDLRGKINGVYGYNAISRIRVTQTAPIGFAEGQAQFVGKQKSGKQPPASEIIAAAKQTAAGVGDENLRRALEDLAQNVLSKNKP